MVDFIAEVLGKESADDGTIVKVRVTGFGPPDGPLMTRAKARAIASVRFGPSRATMEKRIDNPGQFRDERVEVDVVKDENLPRGELEDVENRVQAFRREGLFTHVQEIRERETGRVISDDSLLSVFNKIPRFANTYEYTILATTSFALS